MITCAALASFLTIYSTPEDCWGMQVNLAARNQYLFPKTGLESDITLHRGGLIIGGTKGKVSSRLFLGPIQTGNQQGYIGVGEESIVYRLQMADVRLELTDSVTFARGYR